MLAGSVNSINGLQTAMHWACKRGDENLAKLLAGVSRHLVNERSVSIIRTTICKIMFEFILRKGLKLF